MKFLFLRLLTLAPACLLICMLQKAEAKEFRNAYVSFQLPEKWDCVLEQTEWVCRPNAPALAPQAIIILTAKEVGPSDSLPAYEAHLNQQRTILTRTGQSMPSKKLKVEKSLIANHPWMDGMHEGSEVANYYTRYLATTKDKIAILVTFSAHKLHYTKYSGDFFKAIQSLRVIASKAFLTGAPGSGAPGSQMFGINTGIAMGDGEGLPDEDGTGGGLFSGPVKTILGLALVLGAIGIYLLLKRGQKKDKPKKPPTRRM